jgi:CubicO group peptidase (beta-lactamase class C family)
MSLNDIPGAAVSVWSKGGIIYAKGFGVRSTATNMAMAADTLIDLASVSKSLTGVAVDKLNRQGRIHPDAPVTKYFPELGDAFGRVKIRHLLRHSSGLTRRDDASVTCCGLAAETGLDEAAQELSSAKPSPGVEFVYANSNYVLLAAVLERVSGQPFPVLMQQLVFRPLGMRRTTLDVAEARRWGMADPSLLFRG